MVMYFFEMLVFQVPCILLNIIYNQNHKYTNICHNHWKEDNKSFQMIPDLKKLRDGLFRDQAPKLGHG